MSTRDLEALVESLDAVRRHFEQLTSAAGDAAYGTWSSPLEKWWQDHRDRAPEDVAGYFSNLVEQGAALFQLAERFSGEDPTGAERIAEMMARFGRDIEDGSPANAAISPLHQVLGAWDRHARELLGIEDRWVREFLKLPDRTDPEQIASTLSRLVEQFQGNTPNDSTVAEFHRLVEAQVAYQKQLNRFAELALGANRDASRRMTRTLSENPDSAEWGIVELYAAWLECCEAAYDGLTRRDEFTEAYAGLVNRAVALRQARNAIVASGVARYGMPGYREARQLARAVSGLRRQQRELVRDLARMQPAAGDTPPTPVVAAHDDPAPAAADEGARPVATASRKKVVKKATSKVARKSTANTAKKTARKTAKKVARKASKKVAKKTSGKRASKKSNDTPSS